MIDIWINNNRLDVDSETTISLVYTSPIFSELDKVIENGSYTISLPLTLNNQRAIELSNRLDISTNFPYSVYPCSIYQDELPLTESGNAYLLSISTRIEIVVTWGVDVGDIKTKQLADYYFAESLPAWGTASFAPFNTTNEYFYAQLNYGDNNLVPLFPTLRVAKMLDRLDIDYSRVADRVDPLLMSITGRNGGLANREESFFQLSYNSIRDNFPVVNFYNADNVYFRSQVIQVDYTPSGTTLVRALFTNKTGKLTVKIAIAVDTQGKYIDTDFDLVIYESYSLVSKIPHVVPCTYRSGSRRDYITEIEIDSTETGYFYLEFSDNIVADTFTIDGVMVAEIAPSELESTMVYPIAENLPSITAIEFVKGIMSIIGAFATFNPETKKLELINITDVDVLDSIDWSGKFMGMDSIAYTYLDYAQANTIEYISDDEIESIGTLYVDNQSLDTDKTVVELPFLAISDYEGLAYIPVYEDGEYKGEKDPAIVNMLDVEGVMSGQFLGLDMPNIISTYYNDFQDYIRKPITVKANFKLSAKDLFELDFLKPIYVDQLQGTYAIIELTVTDGVASAELLKIS